MSSFAGKKVIVAVIGYPLHVITITKQNCENETIKLDPVTKKAEGVHSNNQKSLQVMTKLEAEGYSYRGVIGNI